MRSSLQTEPKPRRTSLGARLVRGLWTLPTNLFGHALGALVSGSRGRAVGSDVARARLFLIRLPVLDRIGGITLGHAILLSPALWRSEHGRAILAHELAHTRQHDVLGPLYLPTHAAAQLLSAAAWLARPVEGSDPVHAHNPLEQRWLFLGHAATLELGERLGESEAEAWLERLGCPVPGAP